MTRLSFAVLSLTIVLGFGVRLAYLLHTTSQTGYEWDDPDHYQLKGSVLAQHGRGWRWTFDAVRHSSYDQRFYVLPPAYPVFLSFFALFPGYPLSAQVGQVVLSTLTIAFLFLLGRQIHSERAGLIASAIYAAWLPNIIAVWSTMQESIYVPIALLGFVLLLHAAKRRRAWAYGASGLVFGLATLTRSMPLYALPLLALVVAFRERRGALWSVPALLAGFLALTIPYSVALSEHLGRATFVENHGSIFIVERYGGLEGDEPASIVQTASILVGAFVSAPGRTVAEWWTTTRSVMQVHGGRLLQIYLATSSKLRAMLAKLSVLLFADASFTVCLLLAPFGLVVCRRPGLASFLLIWIVVNIGLVALSGFGGPRLRAPFEPQLIALAAVVLARDFPRPRRLALAGASALSAVLAVLVLPQWPSSLAARADYGVHWPLASPPKRSAMLGQAGFNVLPVEKTVRFHVRPRNPDGRTDVEVRVDGETTELVRLTDQEHRFAIPSESRGLVHVELVATDVMTGTPVRLFVIVPKRP